ncbi:MAG: hypothetical protein R6W99_01100 [Clostridia bacterium]
MRKILIFILIIFALFTLTGCVQKNKIPEGIKILKDDEIECNVYSAMKIAYSLDEFILGSDALLKFRVIEKSYITYQWTDTEYNYTSDIPATVYTVKVLSDFGNRNIKPDTELMIYTEHSPMTYWEDDINLRVNSEYIAFLGLLPDRMPEGLRSYVDYYIMDGELGIFPGINENEYLVNNYTKQYMPFASQPFKSGKETEQEPKRYELYEILPQNEMNWSIVGSVELVDFLTDRVSKVAR